MVKLETPGNKRTQRVVPVVPVTAEPPSGENTCFVNQGQFQHAVRPFTQALLAVV